MVFTSFVRVLLNSCRTDLPSPLSGFDGDMHGNNAATKLLQVGLLVKLGLGLGLGPTSTP
jgi:hypothetical protein